MSARWSAGMICVRAARARDGQGIKDRICSMGTVRAARVHERSNWRCWRGCGACGGRPRTGPHRCARSNRVDRERGDSRRRRVATAFAGLRSSCGQKLFCVLQPPHHYPIANGHGAPARPKRGRHGGPDGTLGSLRLQGVAENRYRAPGRARGGGSSNLRRRGRG